MLVISTFNRQDKIITVTSFLLTGVFSETSVRQEKEGGNTASPGKAYESVSAVPDGNCWVNKII